MNSHPILPESISTVHAIVLIAAKLAQLSGASNLFASKQTRDEQVSESITAAFDLLGVDEPPMCDEMGDIYERVYACAFGDEELGDNETGEPA